MSPGGKEPHGSLAMRLSAQMGVGKERTVGKVTLLTGMIDRHDELTCLPYCPTAPAT